MCYDRRQQNKGFTLIELLVSISIVGVLMTMVIANFGNFEKQVYLTNDSEKFASIVNQAQVWSLTGQISGGSRPVGGYGIYIETCSAPPCDFFMFADQDGDHVFDSPAESISGGDFSLSDKIEVVSIELDGNSSNWVNITFEPPAAKIYFDPNPASYQSVDIGLRHTATGNEIHVVINRISGQIDIQ